jgi:YebC/PmpR family DNA-binding regulatory protein
MGAQWKQKWREMAADKKGKTSTKFVREIQVAAKLGGPHPEYNARLAVAIENAKKASVYKDTIERAIAKGAGLDAGSAAMEELVFEGFAPHRVPVIVEALTENNNRTAPELRVLFRAGSLGAKGSVGFLFNHVALIEAHHADGTQDLESAAIEAGADDVTALTADDLEELPEGHVAGRFISPTTQLDAVGKALKAAGWVITTSEMSYLPKDYPVLTEAQHDEVQKFLQALDDHPDVTRVHAALK